MPAAYSGASGAVNIKSTLDGIFKDRYAQRIENLIPEFTQLQSMIPFMRAGRLGQEYIQPVVLGMEHGITCSKGDTFDAFALIAPIAGQRLPAKVQGSEMLLRSAISIKAAASAIANDGAAFENATGGLVQLMWESVRRRVEGQCFYGQVGYGVVASTSTGGGAGTDTITFTAASWAPGLWSGMKGVHVQFFTGDTLRTGNATADSDYGAYYTVTKVDVETRTITIAENIGASDVQAGDVVYWRTEKIAGSAGWRTMAGIDKIITNTGTLFDIDAGTHDLWKGSSVSAGSAALTFEMFAELAAKVQSKGAVSRLVGFVNPSGWKDLMSDLAALRRLDGSYSGRRLEQGASELTFHTQNGSITVKSHPCVKEGEAFAIPTSAFRRIGATDVTFRRPTMPGVQREPSYFRELENNAGFELRCYCDQAIFTSKPGLCGKITDVVNG